MKTKIIGSARIIQVRTLLDYEIQDYIDAQNGTFYCDVCEKEPIKEVIVDPPVIGIEQYTWKQSLICNDPKCLEYLKLLLC